VFCEYGNEDVLNLKLWVCCCLNDHERFNMEADKYRGADKSLARPGSKQATATEDFDVHISYL
jgi:hypothetical protein